MNIESLTCKAFSNTNDDINYQCLTFARLLIISTVNFVYLQAIDTIHVKLQRIFFLELIFNK